MTDTAERALADADGRFDTALADLRTRWERALDVINARIEGEGEGDVWPGDPARLDAIAYMLPLDEVEAAMYELRLIAEPRQKAAHAATRAGVERYTDSKWGWRTDEIPEGAIFNPERNPYLQVRTDERGWIVRLGNTHQQATRHAHKPILRDALRDALVMHADKHRDTLRALEATILAAAESYTPEPINAD